MSSANSILLNRFFSRNTFAKALNMESTSYMSAIRRYVCEPDGKTNGECISVIYEYIKKEYQNEYYYKNTLLNKLLLGVHSLRTTAALTELPIGTSKADFIMINGRAVVYEIKTGLDNFERLDGQIEDYYKAFSRVVLITSEDNYEEAQRRLGGTNVGIYLLTKHGTISRRREPVEYNSGLSKTVMFKILRKNEYEGILLDYFGYLPETSQFEMYRECQTLFESIPISEAYRKFVQTLKLRTKLDIEEYKKVPYELKFMIYFSDYKKKDYEKLNSFLKQRVVF